MYGRELKLDGKPFREPMWGSGGPGVRGLQDRLHRYLEDWVEFELESPGEERAGLGREEDQKANVICSIYNVEGVVSLMYSLLLVLFICFPLSRNLLLLYCMRHLLGSSST